MTESSFTNFFNKSQGFGLNIKVPEKTLGQIGKTAGDVAGGVLEPLFTYLEKNENVFSGDISHEINKIRAENFTMGVMLNAADEKVNGPRPKFDSKF
jgi:hypothetical protein